MLENGMWLIKQEDTRREYEKALIDKLKSKKERLLKRAEYEKKIKKMRLNNRRLMLLQKTREELEGQIRERMEREGIEIDRKIQEAHIAEQYQRELQMLRMAAEDNYEFDRNMNWDGGDGWGEEEMGILYYVDHTQLDDNILHTPAKRLEREVVFQAKTLPFSDGATRLVHMMIIDGEKYVLKTFKDPAYAFDMAHAGQHMDTTITSSYITEKFLRRARPKKTMRFVDVQVIELVQRRFGETKVFGCIERYIEGDYIKFNSNQGFVRKDMGLTAQTLSHFSWIYSNKTLLMVDLQGINNKSYTLTDPAIHSTNPRRFGGTNLGERGFTHFFETHACNTVCIELGLEKHPEQTLPDDLRETSLVPI
eukprot:TRINITY_DN664_c0_g1_i3.p1 TRINITY_DN664_c0_g1~~TRINITY_DN664_c0_g1_i3.p1  ORF type:complete len:365 (-),score=74.06 TRINITY_DN664_c0_g1_i3:28-1122(-)